jgi:cytochrome c
VLTLRALAAVVLLAAAGCGGVGEKHAALVQQASWGHAVFEGNCARCHSEGRSVDTITRTSLLTGYRNAAALQRFVRETMPFDRPGRLPDSDYWAVTAYLLDRHSLLTLRPDHTLGPLTAATQQLSGDVPQPPATRRGRGPADGVAGADAARGRAELLEFGCGSCHVIPGVTHARGRVGPSLGAFGERSEIAGRIANTPANLIRWIVSPQRIEPGTAMPDLGVPDVAARDMAAYLEALGDPGSRAP